MNKSPVWGTMQHQCHTYKTRHTSRRCGGLCNTNATPTRLDKQDAGVGDYATHTRLHEQVAGTGDYATQMPHLQDSINKSQVWGTMQHQCHTYKTQHTSRRCGGQHSINKSPVWANATHARFNKQVAGAGDYVTLHIHTYKTR